MFQDLRFAFRSFRRTPAFTAIAVITLALGIGANAAIFSVVDSVVLRPLPYPDGERLVTIEKVRQDTPATQRGNTSFLDFEDYRKQTEIFSHVSGYHGDVLVLGGFGAAQRLEAQVVSASFFDTLGVGPRVGRGFAPGEDTDGKNHVVVLTHSGWKKRFGGEEDLVGRTVTLDDTPHTVVGIMPEDFRFVVDDTPVDLFVPIPRGFDRELGTFRGAHYLNVLARLQPGVTLEAARAGMNVLAATLATTYPDSNANRLIRTTQLHASLTSKVRPALVILLGAVGLVLLIACANVANLLLARATIRQREMAVRTALGASRGRLMRQLLTESVVLSLAGAALGVALAMWGLDALRELIPPDIGRFRELSVDGRVLAFTVAVALATGVGFGLVPALQSSGHDPGETLKDAGSRSVHGSHRVIRNVFVVAEIAVATVLLVGAGLMLRSFQRVTDVDPGIRPDDLIVGSILLPDTKYKEPAQIAHFYRDFKARLEAVPGAQAVTLGSAMPFSDFNMSFGFTIAGEAPPPPGQRRAAAYHLVSASHFQTLGIPLRSGRLFTEADDGEKAAPVAIVNEAFARRYLQGKPPLGQRISVNWRGRGDIQMEVVGVVGDVRSDGLDADAPPGIYTPYLQSPLHIFLYAVRATARTGLAESLRGALAAVDSELPLGELDPMTKLMGAPMAERRLNTLLFAIFGAVALLLAVIGVYGVMSYTVTQRVPEIGIRMALGARPGDVVRMVVGQGLVLAGAGVVAGLVVALAFSRVVAGLLWGVSATDPLTYVVIAGTLVVVAVLASWLPARRAARVDPMHALRTE